MRLAGLDIGTSSVKGVAVDETGSVLATAERRHSIHSPRPGWSEQNPEDWVRGARAVLDALGACDEIGFTGQMHGLVCLGRGDEVLRPAILWNDGRTQRQCEEIEARIGLRRLVELVGNRALAGFTAPKLLWLQQVEPEIHARIESILLPKDYVRFRLASEKATDVSDASGTLLFDVGARAWSSEVCAALDVPEDWLPEVFESETVGCAGDQAAGALGVGVVAAGGPASIVLGTSGVVFAAQDSYMPDPLARLHCFCHAAPGAWHQMGVVLSAAGSLAWLRSITGGSYGDLDAAAAEWAPGVDGLLFAPYLTGERTPHADAGARGVFAGLSVRHDRGALARSVLEGVAFALADCLDLIDEVGARPAVGRVSGGGARSELWLEILASVLDLPLEVTAVDEGAAYGAALLAGVRAGVFESAASAAAECVKPVRMVDPRPEWARAYAERRPAFKQLYPAFLATTRETSA